MTRYLSSISAAIALLLTACGSDPGVRCVERGDGCACSPEPREGDIPFAGTCDEPGVGAPAICCRTGDFCECQPVLCGLVASRGYCECSAGITFDDPVASCDGTAPTCCTQDDNRCFCEEGCETHALSRVVSSCNPSTSTVTCYFGSGDYERVSSCE